MQAAIADDYDWVGFDPRGIGETEYVLFWKINSVKYLTFWVSRPQVRCFPDGSYDAFKSHTVLDQGYDLPPNLNDPQTRKALIVQQNNADALFKSQFRLCEENMGAILRYMGTPSVVRDIDYIVTALDGKDALM